MNSLLIKNTELGIEKVFPKNYILNLIDKDSGKNLQLILNSFNMLFLSYAGNKAETRKQVPLSLRKLGLWITYVIGKTVVIEWYNSNAIDDNTWGSSTYWMLGSNMLVGDITISSQGTWVVNGEDTGISPKGDKGDSPLIRIYNNKILVSYDKGVTYLDLNNTPVYTKFRFNSLTNTYLVSYDLGTTWEDISNEKVYHKFRYNQITNKYQESFDFGKTWSDISTEKVYTKFKFNRNTNTYQVSTDLGLNWTDVSSDKVYYQFKYNKETNTHLVSTDFGNTWTNVSEDKVFYLFRTNDNRLLVSTDLGTTWENCSEPIAAWFRWAEVDGTYNIGKIQISRDLQNWEDLSPTITNSLYIKGYVSTVGNLPTSSAAIGDIYMVGPTYDESDIALDYPHYRMWIKLSSGWVDNGEFTNKGPVSTSNIIDGAVTRDKLSPNLQSSIIYDVSALNGGVTFKSLQALLSNPNLSTLIPTSDRHGGMSIRFVQSSDNNYVQYRLMATSFSTTESDWQGVDDIPVVGSNNLVKSGGISNRINLLNIETLIANGLTFGSGILNSADVLIKDASCIYSVEHLNVTFLPVILEVNDGYLVSTRNYFNDGTIGSYNGARKIVMNAPDVKSIRINIAKVGSNFDPNDILESGLRVQGLQITPSNISNHSIKQIEENACDVFNIESANWRQGYVNQTNTKYYYDNSAIYTEKPIKVTGSPITISIFREYRIATRYYDENLNCIGYANSTNGSIIIKNNTDIKYIQLIVSKPGGTISPEQISQSGIAVQNIGVNKFKLQTIEITENNKDLTLSTGDWDPSVGIVPSTNSAYLITKRNNINIVKTKEGYKFTNIVICDYNNEQIENAYKLAANVTEWDVSFSLPDKYLLLTIRRIDNTSLSSTDLQSICSLIFDKPNNEYDLFREDALLKSTSVADNLGDIGVPSWAGKAELRTVDMFPSLNNMGQAYLFNNNGTLEYRVVANATSIYGVPLSMIKENTITPKTFSIAHFGDSITQGAGTGGPDNENCYAQKLCKKLTADGHTITNRHNYGLSGLRSFEIKRVFGDTPEHYDIVTLMIGINDIGYWLRNYTKDGYHMDDDTDIRAVDFREKFTKDFKYCIDSIMEYATPSKMFVATPYTVRYWWDENGNPMPVDGTDDHTPHYNHKLIKLVAAVIKDVCKDYDIIHIVRVDYVFPLSADVTTDATHPNSAGTEIIANCFRNEMTFRV